MSVNFAISASSKGSKVPSIEFERCCPTDKEFTEDVLETLIA